MVMTRTEPDSCPGVLRLHEAADGPLARIRVPGGRLSPEQLQALAAAAVELGDGNIELTSRGNVQFRRVRDAAALSERLTAAGLLPSATHERVRNIIASPLSGRVGGWTDVHPLVPALDEGLRARPQLAQLPGRVLFTLDDGRGDVSGLGGDIGVHAVDENTYALLLAGKDTGVRVPAAEAVDLMLAAAHGFLELRDGQWRLHEIPDGGARLTEHLLTTRPGLEAAGETLEMAARQDIPIGWLNPDDERVALGAGVRLGSLPARTAEFIAAVERPVFVTPWRSLVITDLDEWAAEQVVRVLAPMDLIFDANSPWLLVSACAGRPGCAKSLTDVRADAAEAVDSGRVVPTGAPQFARAGLDSDEIVAAGRQHWSGCDRRCGRPKGEVTDIIATVDGYRIRPAD
ncbi:precorrin-3B synthase [Nocardia seriolae]|uniref:Precorrin-3B synthase n=2 Tax=Nocardia seriolae TaxID=37332 RepID=A0ABC9YRP9_9NOCA|nr:precorrin-3B synthase [Nocardia seriolae]BEK88877.1 precorrin-3B synthase [Nocardia seriolae]GAM45801.1 precorrin-3B synthase [Nocardia seriolae]GAP27761.1 precorrin-3B synthase [Nocardia seriolae]GEM23396.1 precorrin-3B synthase [Nocardia seriolae NBRC 15557]